MHADLEKILNMPSNQIDRTPKPLPQGWYVAAVEGLPEEGESSQQKTPFLEFTMRITDVYKDVNEEAIDEYLTGLDGTQRPISSTTIKNTYYITDRAKGRLLMFLDHLEGLKPTDAAKEKASVKQRVAHANGRSCLIHVKHEPWQSGEGVSARIDQTMIYEE